ncbi:MAG: helix-turn-helix transcriptional regulator [Alphaproteobacteria bacterium]|nr:helix-turn-helix transcriptional regulator [Alphaproteobacteria bacterium]
MIDSLRLLRKKHGLTQRDLAKRLGVAHCFVGRAETCERRLDIMDLIRILRAMDFTNREILKFFEKLL